LLKSLASMDSPTKAILPKSFGELWPKRLVNTGLVFRFSSRLSAEIHRVVLPAAMPHRAAHKRER